MDGISISKLDNPKDTIEIVVKDAVTTDLYKKRNLLLDILTDAYELRKEYCRHLIVLTNMERIHFGSLLDKIDIVRDINTKQMNEKHSNDRENEIFEQMLELEKDDWTESEKETRKDLYSKLNNTSDKFLKKIEEFSNLQTELPDHNHKGEEAVATIQTS